MKFPLGQGAECDLDILVDTRMLIQCNSGGGKSWLIRRILEKTHGSVQHLVIDPEGEFSSLRERFDYVLAAKQGGDTIADPRYAKLLAERLLELRASAILDIYELDAKARVLFVRRFLEALIDAPKRLWHPALVVVDEIEMFCPQTGDRESRDAVIELMLKGRKRGFCGVLAAKRLSKLHKDAAAECNNKLIGRTGLDVDRKRAADELGFSGREQEQALRVLTPGDFYMFGPALAQEVTKVRIGGVETHHPKAGGHIAFEPPEASAKIRALLPKLSDLPQEAEAERKSMDDLKRDLANTRRELTLARKEEAPPDEGLIERRVAAAVKERDADWEGVASRNAALERVIGQAATELSGIAERLSKATNGDSHATNQEGTRGRDSRPARATHDRRGEAKRENRQPTVLPIRGRSSPDDGEIDLTGQERRILNALAWWEAIGIEHPTKGQVGFVAGYRVGKKIGGTFGNYLGTLRSRGLLDYPQAGRVALTDEGQALAEPPEIEPMIHGLHEAILAKLDGPERRVLQVIMADYPDAMTKQEAGDRAGYTVGPKIGGTFGNYLGALRSLGLIDYPAPNMVAATALLFPEAR